MTLSPSLWTYMIQSVRFFRNVDEQFGSHWTLSPSLWAYMIQSVRFFRNVDEQFGSHWTDFNLLKPKPAGLTFTNSTFCPHSVFVWISEQIAIISPYIINWLVLITDTGCLLSGMDWVFKSGSYIFAFKRLMEIDTSFLRKLKFD
jgi:hypothetical protein